MSHLFPPSFWFPILRSALPALLIVWAVLALGGAALGRVSLPSMADALEVITAGVTLCAVLRGRGA